MHLLASLSLLHHHKRIVHGLNFEVRPCLVGEKN